MADRYIAYYEAPFGLLLLESTEDVLLRCKWVEDKTKPETESSKEVVKPLFSFKLPV